MTEINQKGQYSWVKHIDFILVDALCLIVSFLASFHLYMSARYELSDNWLQVLMILILVDLVVTLCMSPYTAILRQPGYIISINSLKLAVNIFILVTVYFYICKLGSTYSRVTIFLTMVAYTFISALAKSLWKKIIIAWRKNAGKKSLLKSMILVSEGIPTEEFIQSLQVGDVQEYIVKAICVIPVGSETIPETICDLPVISVNDGYVNYVLRNKIDAVYISSSRRYQVGTDKGLQSLLDNDVTIYFNIKPILGVASDEQLVSTVGINSSLKVHAHSFTLKQRAYLKLKRLFDIIFAVFGLIVTAVVGLVIKVVYLLNGDRAPIIYSHTRVGLDGKPFKVYKFRTMVPNADEALKDLLQDPKYQLEWEMNQKFSDDPRVTKAGSHMRRMSMDELPQFLNVLKGDMSLFGPRPLVPGELEMHEGSKLYNKIKPGISGWWACNGRSNIEYDERLQLEYYYVKNVSFEIDLLCFLRTVKCVMDRSGAR